MEPADSCNTLSNRPQRGRTGARKLAALLFLWRTEIEKDFVMVVIFPQLGGNLIYPTIFFFETFSPFSCLFQNIVVPLGE